MEVKRTCGEGGVVCVLIVSVEGRATEEASMIRLRPVIPLSPGFLERVDLLERHSTSKELSFRWWKKMSTKR